MNVTLTGRHLIWAECDADWCTHCLTSTYFFDLNGTKVTVIDHHPQLTGSEPYYAASQCRGNTNYDLFTIRANALLTFTNCTLVDIRAKFLIFANIDGSIAFINTQILRMDFYLSFLYSRSKNSGAYVLFDHSYVTGWNRDHPLLPVTYTDGAFLDIKGSMDIMIRSSIFEDNYELLGTFSTPIIFMHIIGYYLELTDSVFRFCMGEIYLNINEPVRNVGALIRNVTVIESNFEYLYDGVSIYGMTTKQVIVSYLRILNCISTGSVVAISINIPAIVLDHLEFHNNRLLLSPPNGVLKVTNIPQVTFLNCVFHNNGGYTDSYAPYLFYSHLLSLGLINPYPQIADFFAQAARATCVNLIYIWGTKNLVASNVTIFGDPEKPCSIAWALDSLQQGKWTMAVSLDAVSMAGGSKYGLSNQVSALTDTRYSVSITNSLFESLGTAVYLINQILFANNSTFRNIGDLISSTHSAIELLNGNGYFAECLFFNCSGMYSGAVYIHLENAGIVSILSVSKCIFDSNVASVRGSDLTFWSALGTQPVVIEIRDSLFRNQYGIDPNSALDFENMILQSGVITNCTFTSNHDITFTLLLIGQRIGAFFIRNTHFDSIFAPGEDLISLALGTLANVTLENVTVIDSVYHNFINNAYSNLYLRSCVFEGNTGIVLYNQEGYIEDHGSYFSRNTNSQNPCLYQDAYSVAVFYGTAFLNNSASQIGVAQIIGPSSYADFEDCVFIDNHAAVLTGVMQLRSSPEVYIHNCTFLNNSAPANSVFLLERALSMFVISNSVFGQNPGSGLLKVIYSTVVLQSVTFTHMNITKKDYQIMLVTYSKLTMENCTVHFLNGLEGEGGCFLSILMGSAAIIRNTEYSEVQCQQDVITVMLSSSLSVVGSAFQNVTSNRASVINTSANSKLALHSTAFRDINVYQGVLFTQETDVTVFYSSFSAVVSAMVLHTERCSVVQIQSSSFDTVTAETEVGAVQSVDCIDIVLKDSNFTAITAAVTAGVQVIRGNVTVDNCEFQRMTGSTHGAIDFEGGSLTISQSRFIDNSAGSGPDSYGGAVYANTPSNTSISMSNNTFTSNLATAGGAVYWNSGQSLSAFKEINEYHGNIALYGNNIAYSGFKLRLGNDSVPVLASGQVFSGSIFIKIVDQAGQVLATDSSSKVLMQLRTGNSLTGSLVSTANKGTFSLSDFIVTGVPGTNATVTLIPNVPNCLNLSLVFPLRKCIIGEIAVASGACVVCADGTYSLSPNDSSCSNCFSNAICSQGRYIYPNPGFWRPNEMYNGLFPCPNSDTCVNTPRLTNTTGVCAEGYTGNMCQSCAAGYSRSGEDKCLACPSQLTNIIRLSFLGLGIFLFIVLLVISALKSAAKKSEYTGVYLKILMNYLHVTILIASFDLNWPSVLREMFNIHALLGSAGEQFMSLDCTFTEAYFKKVVIVAMLPVTLLLVNLAVWVLLYCLAIVRGMREKLICSLIVSLFYAHPIIVQISLSAFHCVTIKPGELWLRTEMDIPCWDHTHSTYSLGAALPSLILWAFGIPAVSLLILVRNRKQLNVLAVKQKVGFLCIGYKETAYFWELLIVYRKVCIILLYVFMSSEAVSLQALALCVLLWIAGNLQSRIQAFQVPELNKLEYRSIWVSIITIYSGIVFSVGSLSYEVELALAGLIILANGNFLLLWIFFFFRACLSRLISNHPRILRFLPTLQYQIPAALRSEHPGTVRPEQNVDYRLERNGTLPMFRKQLYLSKLQQQTGELSESGDYLIVAEFQPRRQQRDMLSLIR